MGTDYLWTGGTKEITVVREGLDFDTDDYLVVQYTKGGSAADLTLYEPTFSALPAGAAILWDFDNRFVSNRHLPGLLTANLNISCSGYRNGLRCLLEVKQNATGNHKVTFNTGGAPSDLPVNPAPHSTTMVEGLFTGSTFYWMQKLTFIPAP